MPGPQDLLAMLGQGGGGGGAIQQVLSQLMQNPAAMQGMQNYMQGQPPTAGMPMPPSQGGGAGMPPGMGMPMPQGGPPMPQGQPEPMPEGEEGDPEQMATDQIDQAGNTWDGVDAPTKNDIERLKEDPNPEAIASFDKQFGEGAAERYIGGGEEEEESDSEGDYSSEDDKEESE
jgi:hypothetical protein